LGEIWKKTRAGLALVRLFPHRISPFRTIAESLLTSVPALITGTPFTITFPSMINALALSLLLTSPLSTTITSNRSLFFIIAAL
jgi:hypothetical protein